MMVTNPLAYHTKMLIKQKACSSIVSLHALKFYKVQFTMAMFGVKTATLTLLAVTSLVNATANPNIAWTNFS
jgi:hypothetical protein